jgi:hypothetical protein
LKMLKPQHSSYYIGGRKKITNDIIYHNAIIADSQRKSDL